MGGRGEEETGEDACAGTGFEDCEARRGAGGRGGEGVVDGMKCGGGIRGADFIVLLLSARLSDSKTLLEGKQCVVSGERILGKASGRWDGGMKRTSSFVPSPKPDLATWWTLRDMALQDLGLGKRWSGARASTPAFSCVHSLFLPGKR